MGGGLRPAVLFSGRFIGVGGTPPAALHDRVDGVREMPSAFICVHLRLKMLACFLELAGVLPPVTLPAPLARGVDAAQWRFGWRRRGRLC